MRVTTTKQTFDRQMSILFDQPSHKAPRSLASGFVASVSILPLPLPFSHSLAFVSLLARPKPKIPRSFFTPKPNANACYAGQRFQRYPNSCGRDLIFRNLYAKRVEWGRTKDLQQIFTEDLYLESTFLFVFSKRHWISPVHRFVDCKFIVYLNYKLITRATLLALAKSNITPFLDSLVFKIGRARS